MSNTPTHLPSHTSHTNVPSAATLSRVGQVESLKLLPKRHCAFVNYVSALDAARAIDTMQVTHRSCDGHMTVMVVTCLSRLSHDCRGCHMSVTVVT